MLRPPPRRATNGAGREGGAGGQVRPGGAGQAAQLQRGDVITAVDGVPCEALSLAQAGGGREGGRER